MKALFATLGVLALFGCSDRGPAIVSVPDVAVTNSFTLVADHGSISGLSLNIQGHLDGTGYVYAANWPTQALSGVVDWKIYHDWFQKSCVLHYHPVGVRTGNLTIRHEFH